MTRDEIEACAMALPAVTNSNAKTSVDVSRCFFMVFSILPHRRLT